MQDFITVLPTGQAVDAFEHRCCGPNLPAIVAPDTQANILKLGKIQKLKTQLRTYWRQLKDGDKEYITGFHTAPTGYWAFRDELKRDIRRIADEIRLLEDK